MMTDETRIGDAIEAAMMTSEGLPEHIYVTGLTGTREEIDEAATAARAWVRAYDVERGAAIVEVRS
jgi:hypothetical protein